MGNGNFDVMSKNDLTEQYENDGYAVVRAAAPPEVAANFLGVLHQTMMQAPGQFEKFKSQALVSVQPVYEFYGFRLPSLMTFHWGLTSRIADIAQKRLLPTYAFFRVYHKGDRCVVHSDRPACEHSFSMPLGYSDDIIWPLEFGTRFYTLEEALPLGKGDDFGDEPSTQAMLDPGDAVVYHGVNYRHGRTQPNPNRWSAHLFLHWVDADGPYKEWAFDGKEFPNAPDFPPLS